MENDLNDPEARGYRVPSDEPPPEPTEADYLAGIDARMRFDAERAAERAGKPRRVEVLAAADELHAASDRARVALAAVSEAWAKLERLDTGATKPRRITAGGREENDR